MWRRLAAVVERSGWRKIITITKFYATLQERSRRRRSAAEQNPDQAGAQYVNLAMAVARKTSWSDVSGTPWLLRRAERGATWSTPAAGCQHDRLQLVCRWRWHRVLWEWSLARCLEKVASAAESVCLDHHEQWRVFPKFLGLVTIESQVVVSCPLFNNCDFFKLCSWVGSQDD